MSKNFKLCSMRRVITEKDESCPHMDLSRQKNIKMRISHHDGWKVFFCSWLMISIDRYLLPHVHQRPSICFSKQESKKRPKEGECEWTNMKVVAEWNCCNWLTFFFWSRKFSHILSREEKEKYMKKRLINF